MTEKRFVSSKKTENFKVELFNSSEIGTTTELEDDFVNQGKDWLDEIELAETFLNRRKERNPFNLLFNYGEIRTIPVLQNLINLIYKEDEITKVCELINEMFADAYNYYNN
ncbi:MAG: hypothetical protein ACT4N5_07500 [Nitrosopumilaceae archaeon]